MTGSVHGVHLVGSVPLPDAESVFRQCVAAVPNRLKRIPDGETGNRQLFTTFQAAAFDVYPAMKTHFIHNAPINNNDFTPEQIDEGVEVLKNADIETGYDTVAIASYEVFRKLREERVIPEGVRFQVSLPTVANVIMPFVQKAFIQRVEPIYEAALFKAMRRIQDAIPHQDLAFQLDIAADTAFWEATDPQNVKENDGLLWFQPWWTGDVKDYCTDYIVRFCSQVDQDVELGMHNCYGDMQHRHWHEPKSLAVVVERQKRVMEASPHPMNFFHMPVPKSAVQRPEVGLTKYLSPLKELLPLIERDGTDVYLGLVHEYKKELTEEMIEAVKETIPGLQFGVATECGGGRMDWPAFEDALKIAAQVTKASEENDPVDLSATAGASHSSESDDETATTQTVI
ncbi:uncharacterized protein MYCFIDRAFT_214291 [Pseudocercospora fijiensis CIRAD86]|uniref:Cobalamin-independent methionine synthase MetE C-terminal/archaeal domain-containing protein n=1 Tax=Pseudocercospora fijiensis (strain CIRAD86) TaxID=383855 RepID=M3APL6_PSEFD|nr:uncharacterized protein MYCFIDRAFT_214291 [Pseudocercospora fijiensis CIRAD86]EME86561.1 hypothetical protein MYCFIDRAFT_214291 [Pseudocercospora fijiensis CIRAD86]